MNLIKIVKREDSCDISFLRPQKKLTSFEDYAVVGYFVPRLQAGAVPAVPSELVLALVDGNLDSLDC